MADQTTPVVVRGRPGRFSLRGPLQSPVDMISEQESRILLEETRALVRLARDCLNGDARVSSQHNLQGTEGILEKIHRDLIYLCVQAEVESS